jgi:hypothetical protein
MTITDSSAKVVRRMTVPGNRGINRVLWNLRGMSNTVPPAPAGGEGSGGRGGGRGGGGGDDPSAAPALFSGARGGGSFVPPGTYKVSLARRINGVVTPLTGEQTLTVEANPHTPAKPADRAAASEYQQRVARLERAFAGASELANNIKTRTATIRRALLDSPADLKILDEAVKLDNRATLQLRALRGDETLRGTESGAPATLQSRVNSAASGTRGLTGAPTGTQEMNYKIAFEELSEQLPKIKALDADLKKLEAQLDAAGVPHTPGRLPEIK